MDRRLLTAAVKLKARELGFALTGVCPAVTPLGIHHFQQWLDAGYAGEMHYLARRRAAYEHPRHVLAGVRSLVMLAMPYRTTEPQRPESGDGRVSRYAWGGDYHELMHDRLRELADFVASLSPGAAVRGVVDTAPLLEREFAQLAGLGWVGKNTLLLNKQLGSWFFLAALLTDLELAYDAPHEADHCGTCRACLDACPTQAFVAPYVLDSRRCISYLTIELRGSVAPELRTELDDWVFGCDVCQDVCPWNHRSPTSDEPAFLPSTGANPLNLLELFELDDESFRRRFGHTPLWRPKRRGLLRNAALVLGNQRPPEAIAALARGLNDIEPLVREASGWALAQFDDARSRQALAERLAIETDDWVRRMLMAHLENKIDRCTAPS